MAVEIREMVIQAKVGDNKSEKSTEPPTQKSSTVSGKVVTKLSYSIKKQIIEDCVTEVLEKLNKLKRL